jgi:hypothetical protein
MTATRRLKSKPTEVEHLIAWSGVERVDVADQRVSGPPVLSQVISVRRRCGVWICVVVSVWTSMC